jgi:hypothetical protein
MPHELSLTVLPHQNPRYKLVLLLFVNKINVNKQPQNMVITAIVMSSMVCPCNTRFLLEFESGYISPTPSLRFLPK